MCDIVVQNTLVLTIRFESVMDTHADTSALRAKSYNVIFGRCCTAFEMQLPNVFSLRHLSPLFCR